MNHLFEFGISQEDPTTEINVLDIQPGDRILTIASAGEVPLSLMALKEKINVTAVDISIHQIRLTRLKYLAAQYLDFPMNGQFLGYGDVIPEKRLFWYDRNIRPNLSDMDVKFWDMHRKEIAQGIVHFGRFELYLNKLRKYANILIGRKNLQRLVECATLEDQERLFRTKIDKKGFLSFAFQIAFHPIIYKNRGLTEKGLIHADPAVGKRFHTRFRNFCTNNLVSKNYFFQFFMIGSCKTVDAFPDFLKPENKSRLLSNQLTLRVESYQQALRRSVKGEYNKLHMSNLTDWTTESEFREMAGLIHSACLPGSRICSRHLLKNQFLSQNQNQFVPYEVLSQQYERSDRFPFYGIRGMELKTVDSEIDL